MKREVSSKPNLESVHKRLASVHARRQSLHLTVSVLGGSLFIPMYFLGQWLIDQRVVGQLFLNTLLWCTLPYLLAVRLLYKSVNLPSSEQRAILLVNTVLPFLLLVLVLALLQKPISRSALLLAGSVTVIWFWLADQWAKRSEKLQLLMLDDKVRDELAEQLKRHSNLMAKKVELVDWTESPADLNLFDGLLLPMHPNLDVDQQTQLSQAKQMHMRIYTPSAVFELLTGRKSKAGMQDPLWQPDGNPAYDLGKRLIDLIITLATAPLWIPLALLVALSIKIADPGPAIYSQWRTGRHGKPFRIYKFRTMVEQKEEIAQFAQTNDDRITSNGRFLRKTRLDEIPQLINVLLGHMSLIGPRPEQHSFVNQFATEIPSYPYRHLVRPGITGWAQVMQGYAASAEETSVKLSYDLYYVSHYSLALDLLIVAKTIKTVWTGWGAR